MNTKEYNGWTNYETWNVKLWLDNDCDSYELARDLVRQAGNDAYRVSKALQEMVEEQQPDLGASMFADLLSAALHEVNWYEIAEHYLADVEPEEDEESEEAHA